MKLIPLSDFHQLSQLPDSAILWLLEHHKLTCSCDSAGRILVDVDSVHNTAMVEAVSKMRQEIISQSEIEIAEKIGSIIESELGILVDSALQQLAIMRHIK